MPHAINIRAFFDCNSAEPFFRLYTLLVAIELALKDKIAHHVGSHDLQKLVQHALSSPSAGVDAQLTTLSRSLGALFCTSLNGARSPVNPAKYPDLRYLRHEADFPGDTRPGDVVDALHAARQLINELKTSGIHL